MIASVTVRARLASPLAPAFRSQLKKKLPMALAMAGKLHRRGTCAVYVHRLRQSFSKHVVTFCAFLGDQRNEEVAPRHDSTPVFRAAPGRSAFYLMVCGPTA